MSVPTTPRRTSAPTAAASSDSSVADCQTRTALTNPAAPGASRVSGGLIGMSRKRLLALAMGLAAILTATSLAPVLATYPGAVNGRIAFGVRAADGSSNIFSAMPDGSGLRQLTTGAGNHLCAAYSADGKQIAYCSDV